MKTKIFISILLLMNTACFAQFKQEVKNVAIFVHEGVELFDFAGPGEVFVAAGRQSPVIDFNVYTVAATEEEITSQTFLRIIPNYSIENCPPPDVIVLPGGATGIPLKNPKVIDWIKKANENTEISLSVCTGAFLLGKAGLLEGLKATTHWGSIASLRNSYPNTEVLEDTKFIDNGKIVTAGGVSSGTEGALHVVSRITGNITAKDVAKYMEYNNWDNRLGLIEKESTFITSVKEKGLEVALKETKKHTFFYGELLNLGATYLKDNKVQDALPILEYLVKKYPVGETNLLLRKVHRKMGISVPIDQEELFSMIEEGEVDKALSAYENAKKEFPKAFIYDEYKLNSLGYKLMNKKLLKKAVKIFYMNTQEYPHSFNVWDSLAEAYLKIGDNEKALKYYKKSLELNPDNTNATNILSKINN